MGTRSSQKYMWASTFDFLEKHFKKIKKKTRKCHRNEVTKFLNLEKIQDKKPQLDRFLLP